MISIITIILGAESYWTPKKSILSLKQIKYKCEIPICTESYLPSKTTNCESIQLKLFRKHKRNYVNTSLPWVQENCA